MLNATANSVINTILACINQEKNDYTKVSIDKIRELLAKIHKIHVGRRWIFYIIRKLIDLGFITRHPRYKPKNNGLWRQMSSMLAFTEKGAWYLISKNVERGRKILKKIKEWREKGDKRWPSSDPEKDTSYRPKNPEKLKRLNDLLTGVTRPIS